MGRTDHPLEGSVSEGIDIMGSGAIIPVLKVLESCPDRDHVREDLRFAQAMIYDAFPKRLEETE